MSQAMFSSEPEQKVSGGFLTPKMFAQPFRLAFKHPEQEHMAIWVEVRSLEGLKKIFERVESGDLVELGRFSSVEMQLWGHLAEHNGFMRLQSNASTFGAGIRPAGDGIAPLAEDLADLFGYKNDVDGLSVLEGIKKASRLPLEDKEPVKLEPSAHEFVKEDGINLTEDGENALLNLVHGTGSVNFPDPNSDAGKQALALRKDAENAIAIFDTTPEATPQEVAEDIEESVTAAALDEAGVKLPPGEIKSGPEATRIGRLIADVGRGLDNEADVAVQKEAHAAIGILQRMIEADKPTLEELQEEAKGLLERYGVTMEELRDLASLVEEKARPTAPGKQFGRPTPEEAQRAQRENLVQIVRGMNEEDFAGLVAASEPEADTDEVVEKDGPEDPYQRPVQSPTHHPPRQDPFFSNLTVSTPINPDSQKGTEAEFFNEMRRLSGLDEAPKSNDEGDSA